MENVVKLNKDDILRLKIQTSEGKDTGEDKGQQGGDRHTK